MKLSKQQLAELISIIESTPTANEKEMEELRVNAPGVYNNKKWLSANSITFYSLKHKPLNNFVRRLTNYDEETLTSIHKIHYGKGSKITEHTDFSDLTCVIILANNSEGGDFIMNGKKVKFKEEGEYMVYNGKKTLHEVTEITNGDRVVLAFFHRDNKINKKKLI